MKILLFALKYNSLSIRHWQMMTIIAITEWSYDTWIPLLTSLEPSSYIWLSALWHWASCMIPPPPWLVAFVSWTHLYWTVVLSRSRWGSQVWFWWGCAAGNLNVDTYIHTPIFQDKLTNSYTNRSYFGPNFNQNYRILAQIWDFFWKMDHIHIPNLAFYKGVFKTPGGWFCYPWLRHNNLHGDPSGIKA